VVALASQKSYISLYVNAVDGEQYLPEKYADRFPKANIGRACIRVKRAADLDPEQLAELPREAVTAPAGKA
jgi:hypothetical protein